MLLLVVGSGEGLLHDVDLGIRIRRLRTEEHAALFHGATCMSECSRILPHVRLARAFAQNLSPFFILLGTNSC